MKNKGNNDGRLGDATDKWLLENDPDYAETKKLWRVPSTDALARDDTLYLDALSEKQRQKLVEGYSDDDA